MPKGYVATAKGFIPWQESATAGSPSSRPRFRKADAFDPATLEAGLPPIVRQSNEAKLQGLSDMLVAEYRRTGVLPPSVLAEIQAHFWVQGNAVTYDQLRDYAAFKLAKAEQDAGTARPINVQTGA